MHFNPCIANYSSKLSSEIYWTIVKKSVYMLAILSWWAHNPYQELQLRTEPYTFNTSNHLVSRGILHKSFILFSHSDKATSDSCELALLIAALKSQICRTIRYPPSSPFCFDHGELRSGSVQLIPVRSIAHVQGGEPDVFSDLVLGWITCLHALEEVLAMITGYGNNLNGLLKKIQFWVPLKNKPPTLQTHSGF